MQGFSPETRLSAVVLDKRVLAVGLLISSYLAIRNLISQGASDSDDITIVILSMIALVVLVNLHLANKNRETKSSLVSFETVAMIIVSLILVYGIIRELGNLFDLLDETTSLFVGISVVTSLQSENRRKRLMKVPNIQDAPLWTLNADIADIERKLETVKKRKERGEPAHRRFPKIEEKLQQRLRLLDKEMRRRRQEGMLGEP